jgi:hypothetical protein
VPGRTPRCLDLDLRNGTGASHVVEPDFEPPVGNISEGEK